MDICTHCPGLPEGYKFSHSACRTLKLCRVREHDHGNALEKTRGQNLSWSWRETILIIGEFENFKIDFLEEILIWPDYKSLVFLFSPVCSTFPIVTSIVLGAGRTDLTGMWRLYICCILIHYFTVKKGFFHKKRWYSSRPTVYIEQHGL